MIQLGDQTTQAVKSLMTTARSDGIKYPSIKHSQTNIIRSNIDSHDLSDPRSGFTVYNIVLVSETNRVEPHSMPYCVFVLVPSVDPPHVESDSRMTRAPSTMISCSTCSDEQTRLSATGNAD